MSRWSRRGRRKGKEERSYGGKVKKEGKKENIKNKPKSKRNEMHHKHTSAGQVKRKQKKSKHLSRTTENEKWKRGKTKRGKKGKILTSRRKRPECWKDEEKVNVWQFWGECLHHKSKQNRIKGGKSRPEEDQKTTAEKTRGKEEKRVPERLRYGRRRAGGRGRGGGMSARKMDAWGQSTRHLINCIITTVNDRAGESEKIRFTIRTMTMMLYIIIISYHYRESRITTENNDF